MIQVMKFGGASVKNPDAIRNVARILSHFKEDAILLVVSAMDKTTNHLEMLAHLARDQKEAEAWAQFDKIKSFHLEHVNDLFEGDLQALVREKILNYFQQIERIVRGILLLKEFPPSTYDRIVSHGELLSTTLVAAYLEKENHDCQWIDARDYIKTDASYQRGEVIWSLTEENIQQKVAPAMRAGKFIVTQGFIGSTTEGKTTTLGREGSDYTGSIFAYCLGAENLTVWKDVIGILNADPRLRDETQKHEQLSYEEAVEMTFYGASVIHPKTIKPLFSKEIPLKVKCFADIKEPGTVIGAQGDDQVITSYIIKKRQAYLHIKPKDFSFMEERLMQQIFDHVYKSGVKVNLVQNSAISLMLCVDDRENTVNELEALLLDTFEVETERELKLFTVMNYQAADLAEAHGARMVQQYDKNLSYVK
ncbi:MAG: aspartate kinase [Bacteroidota bacterium]